MAYKVKFLRRDGESAEFVCNDVQVKDSGDLIITQPNGTISGVAKGHWVAFEITPVKEDGPPST